MRTKTNLPGAAGAHAGLDDLKEAERRLRRALTRLKMYQNERGYPSVRIFGALEEVERAVEMIEGKRALPRRYPSLRRRS